MKYNVAFRDVAKIRESPVNSVCIRDKRRTKRYCTAYVAKARETSTEMCIID